MKRAALFGALIAAVVVLGVATLMTGTVAISLPDAVRALVGAVPADDMSATLISQVRFPRMVTAALAGIAMSVAGLQMQTLFRNPLADPFSLGVSSGASLGVAMLLTGVGGGVAATFAGGLGFGARFGTVVAAALGAAVVLVVVLALARFVTVPTTLLIIGVMLGSGVGALVSLMLAWTAPERVQQYIAWSLGSFSGTAGVDLPILAGCVLAGLAIAGLSVKPLNALLLGEHYARSVGVNVARVRVIVLVDASILTGVVTAFCGPIGFIGIAVPHAARRIVGTSDHRVLMPATALVGAIAALGCAIVAIAPGQVVPINVITSLVGAPVVVAILLRSRAVQGVVA